MRPVLGASVFISLIACQMATQSAYAQNPRHYPELLKIMQPEVDDGFQLPIQATPPFTRPLGPPARREFDSNFSATWTHGVEQGSQAAPRVVESAFATSSASQAAGQTPSHAENNRIVNVQFMEPELAPPATPAEPIPSAQRLVAPVATPPVLAPINVTPVPRNTLSPVAEIPFLPPPPIQTASSPETQWKSGSGNRPTPNAENMIAPPPFEGMNGLSPTPEPKPSTTFYTGDIGTDPFVQEACQLSAQGWEDGPFEEHGESNPYHDDRCPVPDPNGVFEPYVDGQFRLGNRRVIGGGGFYIPVWQDTESVLFTYLEGRGDDRGAADGFFGLGYREYVNPDLIFGAYLSYDLRVSGQGNFFNQMGIGLELISWDWEFRINGYLPGSRNHSAEWESGYSNGTLITRNYQERAYRGLDWEIGHRFLYWGWNEKYEVRWFIGSYHFSHSADDFPSFGGPKGRLELRVNDLGWAGSQSRLEVGIESSVDWMRHEQVFGYARVQIPLGRRDHAKVDLLDSLRRRMLDPLYRPIN